MKWTLMAFMCLASFSLFSADIQDSATGATFPAEVSFEQDGKTYNLQATGVATRKKLIIKVYSIASYLQDAASVTGDKFNAFLNDDKAKQLTFKYVYDVPVEKVRESYRDSFKAAVGDAEFQTYQKELNELISFYKDNIQKGDEHIFRAIPGGQLDVFIKGQKVGTITNPGFVKGLWSVWLGPKSVVNRDNLVSNLK